MKNGTFYINSEPDPAGVIDCTSVSLKSDGNIVLKQNGDTIVLDEKQVKQLLSELNKEYK